jgi:hypothetical protein
LFGRRLVESFNTKDLIVRSCTAITHPNKHDTLSISFTAILDIGLVSLQPKVERWFMPDPCKQSTSTSGEPLPSLLVPVWNGVYLPTNFLEQNLPSKDSSLSSTDGRSIMMRTGMRYLFILKRLPPTLNFPGCAQCLTLLQQCVHRKFCF